MKNIIFILLIFPILIFSQPKLEQKIKRITTVNAAKSYLKVNTSKGKLLTYTESKDQSDLVNSFFSMKKGDTKTKITDNVKTIYKVLDKKSTSNYNIKIMEFDGSKTNIAEINSLRSFILKGIKSGEHKFENLARVYSTHPSGKTGGNLGWTNPGTFSKRFEKVVTQKKIGQLFSFDEYRLKKHYIIYKTEQNKPIKQVTVIKLTETK